VVVKPGVVLTEAEVIAWCKEAVASYKKPKSVEFVAELPRTTTAGF
jgi:acyl-CoA synthetase (AMP-forming)/AMP-acid ligase II